MKVLILGDASSPHIIKWANTLRSEGIDIIIFSMEYSDKKQFHPDIQIFLSKNISKIKNIRTNDFLKIFYVLALVEIRTLIKKIKPDIVHAHYASSYGLLGALLGFHPYVLSVWGGDVISFPETSPLHRLLFKFNLRKADEILSTSLFMANLLEKYTKKQIHLTPFGIDTSVFKPGEKVGLFKEDYDCIIGTIKGLEWYYGIEYLIEAFLIVTQKLPEKKLKLLIVGGGALESKIKNLIKELNLEDKVFLTGRISYNEVQKYHNTLDIYVAVSVYQESFGVSVLEASACEKPVIISRVGGMIEVVDENVTGFIVPPRNPEETANKMMMLINNSTLRVDMGKAGRKMVERIYNINECIDKMISVYRNLIPQHSQISSNKKSTTNIISQEQK
jgi:L-malate glycosyltransferase